MLRFTWRHAACAFALAALAISPALSAPDTDITGDWKLTGQNGVGSYTGTATISRTGDQFLALLAYSYDDGSGDGQARVTGTFDGQTLSGQRLRTTGITGVLSQTKRKPVPASYTLSADGLTLSGTYAGFTETFTRDALPAQAHATITADPLLTFVPGAPGTIFGKVHVEVQDGSVTLACDPADALRVDASGELAQGSYDFKAEPLHEGPAELRLLSGGVVVARAAVKVEKEQLYLVLFGYMGTEVNYLPSDMATAKSHVLPRLQQAGYTVIEDGKSFAQSTIDAKLNDPKTPRKVVVDWCTTTADFDKYFARKTVRGYIWSSHGFMEPYPGCPDSELTAFESRQWSCADGAPETTGDKHFIREWRAKLEANVYSKLDFGLNHACCTGGIGDYANECWEYCDSATQERAKQVLGDPLPGVDKLTFTTHDSLRGHFNFQQSFNGSSYFGMYDVRWSDLEASIAP